MKLGTIAHHVAQATDDAWQVELVRYFGKNAGDFRYTKHGRGEEGSTLRKAYDARTAAQEAWHEDV